ncbi:MAG TPA: hypothetical protein VIY47_04175 [Ignavibacteriaceae bacterium]
MKTFLTFFIITILFNIYTFAQREIKTGGKGQESGIIERIKRNSDNKQIVDKHPGTIERPPKKIVERPPQRPPKKESGVPIECDNGSYCPENTAVCKVIVDNGCQYLSNEELAIQYFDSGDLGRALLNIELAIKSDLFNPGLYFLRGKIYFELNDYIQAKRDFTTVNVIDPLFPDAYYYRGMSNLYLGEMKLAMEDFRIASSLGDTVAESFLIKYSN